MEMVNIMYRSYERAPSFRRKEDDGKLGRINRKTEQIETYRPYVLRDKITIKMDEMA